MKNFFQRILISFVSRASVIIGNLHLPFIRKGIGGSDYREMMRIGIRKGDVLLSITNGEMGNLFIPGKFSHAAIVDINEFEEVRNIIESVGVGVRETDIIDFFMNKDVIMLVRPKFASGEQIEECLNYVRDQIGKPYNFEFKFSEHDEKHYCCELIYKGYNKAVPNSPFTLRKTLGIDTVVPDDFRLAKDKWEIIWVSQSFKDEK